MRLTFIQRLFCFTTFFALFISGLVWLIFNFYLEYDTPLRFLNMWNLKLHGLAAFGFLIMFGMLISTHISFNWRVRKNRRISGIILTTIFVILIISGYCLYYLGGELSRTIASYTHWILGIISFGFFMFHYLKKCKKPSPTY